MAIQLELWNNPITIFPFWFTFFFLYLKKPRQPSNWKILKPLERNCFLSCLSSPILSINQLETGMNVHNDDLWMITVKWLSPVMLDLSDDFNTLHSKMLLSWVHAGDSTLSHKWWMNSLSSATVNGSSRKKITSQFWLLSIATSRTLLSQM